MRTLCAAVAAGAVAGLASAQPATKKPDDKVLVTMVYDLKHVLGDRGKAAGITDADSVIKMIFETIPLGEVKPGSDGPQLVERDGGKLEVRATAKVQEEVKDLIDAIHRLLDVAIDVKAEVIEFDAAAFDRLAKAAAKAGKAKRGSPVIFSTPEDLEEKEPTAGEKAASAEMAKALKAGRVVQTSTGRYVHGIESAVSARQTVVRYENIPGAAALGTKPQDNPLFVKDGFRLSAVPVVSADRRFVRLKLTEQSTAVVGVKKRHIAEVNGQKIVASSPDVDDLGATASATVPDGGLVLVRLAYAPKDKVWVVALHPTIFIQAEEDFLKREKEEKK